MPYLNKSDLKTVDHQYQKLSRLKNSTFNISNLEKITWRNIELKR
jgi:hypothetical protein